MGLRDILTDMQNGPRGQRPPTSGGSGGGMSPIVLALLGLLAFQGAQGPRRPYRQPRRRGPDDPLASRRSGAARQCGRGLGHILSGGLGGLLGGAAAGSVLSGGLGNLIKGFQDSGHGHAAKSWVGTGPNKEIAPGDLADALGSDTLDTLSRQTGMGQNDLLEALRQQLPDFVDQLTPHGRIPTEEEASRMV